MESPSWDKGLLTWNESNQAAVRLEDLLRCFICHKVMVEPHTLGGCDHHFCRSCINNSLSDGCGSNCPECGLPVWVKDLKTNRQMDNLTKLVSSMKRLLSNQAPDAPVVTHGLPSSTEANLVAESHNVVSSVAAESQGIDKSVTGPTLTTRGEESPLTGDTKTDHCVFKKPRVDEKMIRRRIKRARKTVLLGAAQNPRPVTSPGCVPSSLDENGQKSVLISSDQLSSTSLKGSIEQWQPFPSPIHKLKPSVQSPSPLLTSHRSCDPLLTSARSSDLLLTSARSCDIVTNSKSDSTLSSETESSDCSRCVLRDNPTVSGAFGKPSRRRKRRSLALEETTVNIPSMSVEFPFSPLITKTRNYSKLDRSAKLDRLQRSGYGKDKNVSQSTVKRKTHSGHQTTLHSFVSTSDRKEKGESSVSVLPVYTRTENHTPPATPTSMHARTMRRNIRGETPLHLAAIKGSADEVRMLLQQGADPNVKDNAGWTPLHEACNHGHTGVATVLLDHNALINIPGFDNDTPLHDAVANGRVDVVKLLLERGANVALRNRQGLTAQELAVSDVMRKVFGGYSGLHVSPNAIKSPHASPVLNGGPSQVVLLSTGLKGYQKKQLDDLASMLGAEVVESFSTSVSHVVTVCNQSQCCSRTLKFLCGVATGKWIVSYQWISACLESQSWIDETEYEVQGVIMGESNLFSEAPKKGRENSSQKLPGLFDGCRFFLTGVFSPPQASKDDLGRLIKLAGGKVISREPRDSNPHTACPYHMKQDSKVRHYSTFIVYDPCCKQSERKSSVKLTKNKNVAAAPASWLLDCLSCFELISV